MKLWDKGYSIDDRIERFTTGRDRELDIDLAPYDVQGTKAHANMLAHIGLLTKEENTQLQAELKNIEEEIADGKFSIQDGIEDVHSQVELMLTLRLGDVGKKIHLGRSRNDQVLVDLRLFFRAQLTEIGTLSKQLIELLLNTAAHHKNSLIPGYTHMQIGMVSSFGMWFSGYAEALIDDLEYLLATRKSINRNPLGTAAGYGSSIPLDRQHTTAALAFEGLCVNPINSQIGRGKTELMVANAISTMALSINKMAMDICMFSNENYGFLSLPKEFTTGSSIMPHKKNPDVFELIRAKCNMLISVPSQLSMMLSNLPSGYHRDFQLQKELIFPAIEDLKDILGLIIHCVPKMIIKQTQVYDEKYQYLFSVELVNQYVLEGMSFRDAYKKVGLQIESGKFVAPTEINHTHIGSLGNLGIELMTKRLEKLKIQ